MSLLATILAKEVIGAVVETVSAKNLKESVKGKNLVKKSTGEAILVGAALTQIPVPDVTADNLVSVAVYGLLSLYSVYKFLRSK